MNVFTLNFANDTIFIVSMAMHWKVHLIFLLSFSFRCLGYKEPLKHLIYLCYYDVFRWSFSSSFFPLFPYPNLQSFSCSHLMLNEAIILLVSHIVCRQHIIQPVWFDCSIWRKASTHPIDAKRVCCVYTWFWFQLKSKFIHILICHWIMIELWIFWLNLLCGFCHSPEMKGSKENNQL